MTPRKISDAGLATTRSVNRWIEQFNKENGTEIPKGIDRNIVDVAFLDWIQDKVRNSKGDEAAIQFERLRDPNNPFPELSLNRPEEDPHANDVEGIVSKTVVPLSDGRIAIVDDEPRGKSPIESNVPEDILEEYREEIREKKAKVEWVDHEGEPVTFTDESFPFTISEKTIQKGIDELDKKALEALDEMKGKTGIESPEWKERAQKLVDEVKDPPQEEEKSPWTFRRILSVLPLPMLGLAASYGVYHFAANFAPDWVAIAEASAFELTYIGLAALEGLSKEQKERAGFVARGAVTVSIIYNSIAGALYLDPQLFENLGKFAFWAVSILHGVPLAVLAYLVADLVLHSDQK